MTLLRELAAVHGDADKGQFERADLAIQSLRDEIVALNFATTRGQNRLIALCVAKLEEAQGLAILAGIETNRLAVVDRKKILAGLTDTTETTDTNGSVSRV